MSNQYYYFQLFSCLTKIRKKRHSNASFVELNDCRQVNYVKHMQSFLLTVEHLKYSLACPTFATTGIRVGFGRMVKILGSTAVNQGNVQ